MVSRGGRWRVSNSTFMAGDAGCSGGRGPQWNAAGGSGAQRGGGCGGRGLACGGEAAGSGNGSDGKSARVDPLIWATTSLWTRFLVRRRSIIDLYLVLVLKASGRSLRQ